MRLITLALLPGLSLATILLASWPGYLSFDSAFQWYQARYLVFADIAPPLLPALWAGLLQLGLAATTGPLLLIALLFAFGFARLALNAERRGQPVLASLIAGLGPACPLLILLLPHVWTDLLLAASLLAAVSLLDAPRLRLPGHLAIGLMLFMATAARHNGVLAVLPLALWWAWCLASHWSSVRKLALGGLLVVLLWGGKWGLGQVLVQERLDTWAVAPMHDLQAVSIATGQQLLPSGLVGPGMDVAQLQAAFHPYSATLLFSGTESGVANPTIGALLPQQRQDLREAWLGVLDQPAWWAHRWRMFRGLLGSHRAPELQGLVDDPSLTPYADNPALQPAAPAAHFGYRKLVNSLRGSPLYAPGWYLLLGMVAMVFWWRRAVPGRTTGLILLASAWVYTLPYFLLAPSAETRYVLWPVLASWLVLLASVGGVRRQAPE